uniref:Uncharacterized protein n=1 Tax=Marseillevirus sp. TaxID=2809551 RepID=A0AA96ELV1_9VIRU|nr:hypothetical protein MarDSR_023 [Marseillevirus sp.]
MRLKFELYSYFNNFSASNKDLLVDKEQIYRKTSNFFSSSLLSQKCKSRSRTKFPKL